MKTYEKEFTSRKLDSTTPVIVRLDGKAFHSYTRHMTKPFSLALNNAFKATITHLYYCVAFDVAYHQSDEITLVFLPKSENSELIFGGKISKINSVLSSMTTYFFNKEMSAETETPAFFDCRCFNVPDIDEAANCIFWRMQDALRNSVSMLAQSQFSHKQLLCKSCEEMKKMLNGKWENLPLYLKQGSFFSTKLVWKDCVSPSDWTGSVESKILRRVFSEKSLPDLITKFSHDERKNLFFAPLEVE